MQKKKKKSCSTYKRDVRKKNFISEMRAIVINFAFCCCCTCCKLCHQKGIFISIYNTSSNIYKYMYISFLRSMLCTIPFHFHFQCYLLSNHTQKKKEKSKLCVMLICNASILIISFHSCFILSFFLFLSAKKKIICFNTTIFCVYMPSLFSNGDER